MYYVNFRPTACKTLQDTNNNKLISIADDTQHLISGFHRWTEFICFIFMFYKEEFP